jgi:ATP-dependent RNA/DNA helicase IGHMBP2
MSLAPHPHFQRLQRLLDLEAEAEKQAALWDIQRHSPAAAEASGSTLINLVIRDEAAGLGGRILLTFAKRNQTLKLPWTRLGSGTPVILSEEGRPSETAGWRGVVNELGRDSLQVAFPDWPEPESGQPTFRLDRFSDEISHQRQRQGLQRAESAEHSRLADLRDVLLGFRPPAFHPADHLLQPLNPAINPSQWQAVRLALSAEDVAIIHGPPGTGKTTTLVELARQLTCTGQRVLAVAPSNLAVDTLFEKLLASGEKALRVGHPARVRPELRSMTLDALAENHPNLKLARKLVRDAYALRLQASKHTRARPLPGERAAQRQEARQMLRDARRIEDQVVAGLLGSARIVCATLTGLDRDLLESQHFDWCIMDEASQCTEAAAWAPLQVVDRLVLAGDPFQLPPTLISASAAAEGFGVSLLERLVGQFGKAVSSRLEVQYRMHQHIMQFSSQEFYDNSQVADASVQAHLLQDLPGLTVNSLTGTPLDFIDTAGASYDESLEPDGDSRFNLQEAGLAVKKVQALLASGLAAAQIAVISPYSAQVRLLRASLPQPDLEIDSVDGFQGREKEAVIVSLVRSNREGEIGFLSDIRRMNVALTRARRKLIVIGDSATISSHPFYQRMLTWFESLGAYHSVWEEQD